MRRKLVIGNWKMNLTRREAAACVEGFVRAATIYSEVEVGVAPSYLCLTDVVALTAGVPIIVGGQDVFWLNKGAYTGQVSAGMLQDAGAKFCLIGHSECRGRFGKVEVPPSTVTYFGDTDETVNLKLKALLFAGLTPVLCCGETLEERESGTTDEVIRLQITNALAGCESEELTELVVAYEPIWAIGTGQVCDTEDANRVIGTIRKFLTEILGPGLADAMRILYGGSVKGSNAQELFSASDIDGGLVGGASLDPHDFARIIEAAH